MVLSQGGAMDYHVAERIAWCRQLREEAAEHLRGIEAEDWRLFSAEGGAPMADVTNEWAERERRTIDKMDKLIAAYGANDP
jgi:hypothetical protein